MGQLGEVVLITAAAGIGGTGIGGLTACLAGLQPGGEPAFELRRRGDDGGGVL